MIVLHQPAFRAHEIGLSLVELMIAMVLGLAVVAGVSTLSLNATRSYRALNQAGEQIENGRYALRILKNDLEHAGFFGAYVPKPPLPKDLIALPDPCDIDVDNLEKGFVFFFPVVGYESSPGKCEKITRLDGTNVLVIRRADTSTIAPGTKSRELYTNPEYSFKNSDGRKDIREYHVNIFYIAVSDIKNNIPTLYRFSPTDDLVPQPIVDGIENLQLMFGVDGSLSSDPNCNPDLTGDGAPDGYFPLDSFKCPKDWSNVVAVRLDILARSTEPDPNYTDAKTYSLGNVQLTPTEKNYHRRVFSQVVRLVNISGRREK